MRRLITAPTSRKGVLRIAKIPLNPPLRKWDLEENRGRGKPVFSWRALLEDRNRELAFLAIGKRNAKRGAAAQQGVLKSRLRIVRFVAAM
jgi:hypothetical protein